VQNSVHDYYQYTKSKNNSTVPVPKRVKHSDIGYLFQRPCISRRVTVQEHISAYMDSPLDGHFFGPDLTPPGRLHHARAYHHHRHHSPPDLEEEVSFTSLNLTQAQNLTSHVPTYYCPCTLVVRLQNYNGYLIIYCHLLC
jgi:hypothetical protein